MPAREQVRALGQVQEQEPEQGPEPELVRELEEGILALGILEFLGHGGWEDE